MEEEGTKNQSPLYQGQVFLDKQEQFLSLSLSTLKQTKSAVQPEQACPDTTSKSTSVFSPTYQLAWEERI
jgi:hypothetical protein